MAVHQAPIQSVLDAIQDGLLPIEDKISRVQQMFRDGASLSDGNGTLRILVLGQALLTGSEQLVALLLDNGGPSNGCMPGSQTPFLLYTIDHNRTDMVKLLLKHGADPDGEDGLQRTPLSQALLKADYDLVQAVVDGGANVGAETERQSYKGAIQVVRAMRRDDILKLVGIEDDTPYGIRPSTPSPGSGKSGRRW